MKAVMCGVCVFGVLAGVGCAAESAEPEPAEPAEARIGPTMCEPLRGVYRVTYARKNGDCDELPVQLAKFRDDTTMSALSSQCDGTVETSEDACDRTEDGDCHVASAGAPIGTAHLRSMFTQTSEIRIEGSAEIEVDLFDGSACSATYALIGDKIGDDLGD